MKYFLGFIVFFNFFLVKAQVIRGFFPHAINKEIILQGYEGFEVNEISKALTDSLGNFTIKYPKEYIGAGILQIQNASSIIVLLNKENFTIDWLDEKDFTTLKFKNSPENDAFANGIVIHQEAELKLNALKFLLTQYKNLASQQQWLKEEIDNQEQQFTNFLSQLPMDSYAKYYLNIRKLIADFPQTANRNIERMPQHELDFNNLNFNEPNLYSSGLLKEFLEGYFLLMESHLELNEMYQHMNASTDAWVKNLAQNPTLQQVIAQHMFSYFEKRNLNKAAEHIALSMFNQANCKLNDKSINLFEQYRKLAIGNSAPNIVFKKQDINGIYKDLKSLKNAYKLVVFGASWCPNCQTDYPSLVGKYKKIKEKHDLEVVYIAMDTDKEVYETYFKEAPFITYCDTKGWETQAAKDYFVYATPTYILVNKDLKILAKLQSPEHLETWFQEYNK